MSEVLLILAGWFALSIVVALIVGPVLKAGGAATPRHTLRGDRWDSLFGADRAGIEAALNAALEEELARTDAVLSDHMEAVDATAMTLVAVDVRPDKPCCGVLRFSDGTALGLRTFDPCELPLLAWAVADPDAGGTRMVRVDRIGRHHWQLSFHLRRRGHCFSATDLAIAYTS